MALKKSGRWSEIAGWLFPVALGAVLRFWGLGFGLPSKLRPDEDLVVLPSLAMIGGDIDPQDYTYPTLYKYILAALFRVCLFLGIGPGSAQSAWQYAAYGLFVDGSFHFFLARCVCALLGVASVYGVYLLGKEGYGRFVGIAGALFLSVCVLHVRDSHFGVTDIASVCLLIYGMVYIVRVVRVGGIWDYVWGSVFLGLATGTKYGTVLGAVALIAAHMMRKGGPVWRRLFGWELWLAGGITVVVFAITSPFVFLNLEKLFKIFELQRGHLSGAHGADLGLGWWYHLSVSLRYGLGLFMLLFLLGGVGLALMRRGDTDVVLLSLLVVYYCVCGQSRTVFFRYMLPIVPLCCVFAGMFVDWLRTQAAFRNRSLVVGVLGVVLGVVEPLWGSIRLDMLLSREDTRVLARNWIEKHIPAGQKIANVGGIYGDVPVRNRYALSWWLASYFQAFPDMSETKVVDYLSNFSADFGPFYLYTHFLGIENIHEQFRGKTAVLEDPEVAYVIVHDHPLSYSTVYAEFLTSLEKQGTLIQEFSPGSSESLEQAIFDHQDAFYYPLGRFGDLERGGPVIQIWRLEGREGFVHLKPGNPRWLFIDAFWWLGNSKLVENQFNQAEVYYKRGLKLTPDHAGFKMFLGVAYLFQDRFDDALDAIQDGLKGNMTADQIERAVFLRRASQGDLYVLLGDVFAALELYTQAIDMYQQAVSMGFEKGYVHSKLGVALVMLKRFEEAEVQFQKTVGQMALDNEIAQMRVFLGIAMLSQGQISAAKEELQHAIDLDMSYEMIDRNIFLRRSTRGDMFVGLGAIFASLERFSESANYLERGAALGYKNADVYNNLGVLYYKMRDYNRAEAAFRKALLLDPEDRDVQRNLKRIEAYR